MTVLNFRHISFFTGNLALSFTKHVQDGSDILCRTHRKFHFSSSVTNLPTLDYFTI